jgi:tetratricopeptide (TPR) repeat protein
LGGPDRSMHRMAEELIRKNAHRGVYIAAFDPHAFPVPQAYDLVPHGVLLRISERDSAIPLEQIRRVWSRYSTQSFYEHMERDYMNRQVCGYFYFNLGRFFLQAGLGEKALQAVRLASRTAYNDEMIHSDVGVVLTDYGFFDEARQEFDKALLYDEDKSGAYNNLGYYHSATGNLETAILCFQKAVDINPKNFVSYNNLGRSFLRTGRKKDAMAAFRKSLAIRKSQPEIAALLEKGPP